jgi:class 3 adenylate cyclase
MEAQTKYARSGDVHTLPGARHRDVHRYSALYRARCRDGDLRWRDLLNQYYAAVRKELSVFNDREVNTAGDGLLATFDAPNRAIQCACSVREKLRPLRLQVRTGLHTGECELIGDDVGGIAVHIAARLAAAAEADEVLVSSTVRDLVAGSGLRFADRGTHGLKG